MMWQPDDPPPDEDFWTPMTMEEAYPPPHDRPIEGMYPDGTVDIIRWQDERYCMLGAPQGSCGPGWVSIDAGNLPVDEPTHWRPVVLARDGKAINFGEGEI